MLLNLISSPPLTIANSPKSQNNSPRCPKGYSRPLLHEIFSKADKFVWYRYTIFITTISKALTSPDVMKSVWPSISQAYVVQELLAAFRLLNAFLDSLSDFSCLECQPSICASALTFLPEPAPSSPPPEAFPTILPSAPLLLPSLTPEAPAAYTSLLRGRRTQWLIAWILNSERSVLKSQFCPH